MGRGLNFIFKKKTWIYKVIILFVHLIIACTAIYEAVEVNMASDHATVSMRALIDLGNSPIVKRRAHPDAVLGLSAFGHFPPRLPSPNGNAT